MYRNQLKQQKKIYFENKYIFLRVILALSPIHQKPIFMKNNSKNV